jgi:hypothetical protein
MIAVNSPEMSGFAHFVKDASRESGPNRSRCMSAAWYIYQPGLLPAWGLGTRHCGQTFKRAG